MNPVAESECCQAEGWACPASSRRLHRVQPTGIRLGNDTSNVHARSGRMPGAIRTVTVIMKPSHCRCTPHHNQEVLPVLPIRLLPTGSRANWAEVRLTSSRLKQMCRTVVEASHAPSNDLPGAGSSLSLSARGMLVTTRMASPSHVRW